MYGDAYDVEDKERIISRALPMGTVLHGQYEIVSVLGEGGFAITYMGRDKDGRTVAVKEYFPSSFAMRENEGLHIFSETRELFDRGKRRFIKEAEVLRKFQYLDGIAAVYDCFEENDTAYIVMEYIEGITLKEYVIGQGVLSYGELVSLVSPIMNALSIIHRHGVIHRDISPDNIIIGLDNKARLIDFGAAGLVNGNSILANDESRDEGIEYGAGEMSGKTVILKTGYAPPEQYIEGGKLGAWTDVYGLAATLYMGITGRAPMDTVERLQRGVKQTEEELYVTLLESNNGKSEKSEKKSKASEDILPWQAKAIITGLAPAVDERFTDMGEFYDALTVEPSIEHDVTVMGDRLSSSDKNIIREFQNDQLLKGQSLRKKPDIRMSFSRVTGIVLLFGLAVAVCVIILRYMTHKDMSVGTQQQVTVTTETSDRQNKDITTKGSSEAKTESSGIQNKDITTEMKTGLREESSGSQNNDVTTEIKTDSKNTEERQQKKTEKATTEAVKVHEEEDGVEHLEIEE